MASTITMFTHLQIPLEEVVKATNNFDDKYVIGEGGFGKVYRGQLSRSGKLENIVARRLDRKCGQGEVEFWTEISVLSSLEHENIISLIGFCDENGEKIIISTRKAKGSLSMYLSDLTLTWIQRLKICVGVARALRYIHNGEGRGYSVIHRNINSSTILLDDNWEAKLSGFEFSIKQTVDRMDRVVLSEAIGTTGYMDPSIVKTGGVTHKSDIYSFGVVLCEILCGRKAFIPDHAGNGLLAPLFIFHYENRSLKDTIHPDLRYQMTKKSLTRFIDAAYSCLKEDWVQRPKMNEIVIELEKALELENLIKHLEHLKIPLGDIMLATDYFSKAYQIRHRKHYDLYRAELEHFDEENPSIKEGKNKGELHPRKRSTVVIKRFLPGEDGIGEEMFYAEIEMLDTCKHPSIVKLLGFCHEGCEMILVVEHLSNGYLFGYWLEKTNGMRHLLTWAKRLKICLDVANALNYLHAEMEDQKVIIHRGIMSYNIALDENWGAKIVDFRLSVLLPPNQDDDALYHKSRRGPEVYIDPEYSKTGKLKRESDVYSFGLVLFEVLCGRIADDRIYLKESDELGLAFVVRRSFREGTLMEMIDPILKEESGENCFILKRGPNKDSLEKFIKIALECIAETQDRRPTMKVVIQKLRKALFFQEDSEPIISLEDVKLATRNFYHENRIGGGGFGNVYKGKLPNGDGFNTIVAKRLDTRLGQGEHQFRNEVQILLEYKHENVVRLVRYCDEKDEKIIVYEYASRGSLDRYLKDARLTWNKRLNICIDVATALDFLHGGAGKQAIVIHRDIKTANILLNDEWNAKLADFGLSLISPINKQTDYVIAHACGTKGYLDPLYLKSGFLTIESDIYSFGVVLFEILCGRSTFEIRKHKGQYLPGFIKESFEKGKHDDLVFEALKEQIVPKALTAFQTIAYQCLHDDREKRPTAKEVLEQLKEALEFQAPTTAIDGYLHMHADSNGNFYEPEIAANYAEIEDIVSACLAREREQWQSLMISQMMSQIQTNFQSQIQSSTDRLGNKRAELYDTKKTALERIVEEEKKRTMFAAFSFLESGTPTEKERRFLQKAKKFVMNEYKHLIPDSDNEE